MDCTHSYERKDFLKVKSIIKKMGNKNFGTPAVQQELQNLLIDANFDSVSVKALIKVIADEKFDDSFQIAIDETPNVSETETSAEILYRDPSDDTPEIVSDQSALVSIKNIDAISFKTWEQDFKTKIVESTIFRFDPENSIEEVVDLESKSKDGKDQLINSNIWAYKKSLLDTIEAWLGIPGEYDRQINRIDACIKRELKLCRQKFNKGELPEKSEVYKAYYLLENFDSILERATPFIGIKPEYKITKSTGLNAYTWNGSSIHLDTHAHNKEASDISTYSSKMVQVLADYLPELDDENKPTGRSLGFNGFNLTMIAVKNWVNQGYEVPDSVIDEYSKGDTCNWDKIFKAYLAAHDKDANRSERYRINSIKHFILGEDSKLPSSIRADFKAQVRNTTGYSFIVYREGSEGYDANTTRKSLHSTVLQEEFKDAEGLKLLDNVSQSISNFRSNPELFKKVLEKWSISIVKDATGTSPVFHISFSPKNTDPEHNLVYNSEDPIIIDAILTTGSNNKSKVYSFKYNDSNVGDENFPKNTLVAELIEDLGIINMMPKDNAQISDLLKLSGVKSDYLFTAFKDVICLNLLLSQMESFDDGREINNMPIIGIDVDKKLNKYNDGFLSLKSKYQNLVVKAANFKYNLERDSTSTILKNGEGNNIPGVQMCSSAFETHEMIYELTHQEGIISNIGDGSDSTWDVFEGTDITKNGVLRGTYVRSDCKIGETVKQPMNMTPSELIHFAVLHDFYHQFNANGTVLYQPTCLADKSTHFLMEYDLSEIELNDKGDTMHSAVKALLNGDKSTYNKNAIINHINDQRASMLRKKLSNQIKRFKIVYGDKISDQPETYEGFKKNLKEIEDILNKTSEADLKKAFADKEVDLYKNFDYLKAGGSLDINDSLLYQTELYLSPDKHFADKIDSDIQYTAIKMIKRGTTWNTRFDPSIKDIVEGNNYLKDNWSKPFANNEGELIIAKVRDSEGNLTTIEPTALNIDKLLADGYTLEINPILSAQTLVGSLLNDQLDSLVAGGIEGYDYKGVNHEALIEQYEDGDISKALIAKHIPQNSYFRKAHGQRVVAKNKRAVIYGSTRLGLNYDELGPSKKTNVAVMSDRKVQNFTPGGINQMEVAHDGSGWSNPYQAYLENYGYRDGKNGRNKKSIYGYMDPQTGVFTELKWACFMITNEERRKLGQTKFSAEQMFKKMNSISINDCGWTKDRIASHINTYIQSNPIYRKDPDYDKYYKLEKAVVDYDDYGNQEIITIWKTCNKSGGLLLDNQTFELHANCNNFYEIDKVLGGAWVMSRNTENKNLEFSEDNIKVVVDAMHKNSKFKEKFIGYVVNESAIKVGARNVNSNDIFGESNDAGLRYFTILNTHGGKQMDPDHDIDFSEVTEMSQMISSLAQRGLKQEITDQIYEEIGNVAVDALKDFDGLLDGNHSAELRKKLGKLLIDSFNSGSKDTMGLAQAFLRKAMAEINGSDDVTIPFSATTLLPQFVAQIASMINKRGIKRKFAGGGFVQVPSRGWRVTHNIGGEILSSTEARSAIRKILDNAGRTESVEEALKRNAYWAESPKINTDEHWIKYLNNLALDGWKLVEFIRQFSGRITYAPGPVTDVYGNSMDWDQVPMVDGVPINDKFITNWKATLPSTWEADVQNYKEPTNPLIKRILNKDIASKIRFNKTYVYRLKGTNDFETVTVDTIEDYYNLKYILDRNQYDFYEFEGQPKDLTQGYVEVTTNQGIVFTEYDSDATMASYFLQNILNPGKNESAESIAKKKELVKGVLTAGSKYIKNFPKWNIDEILTNPKVNEDKIEELTKMLVWLSRQERQKLEKGESLPSFSYALYKEGLPNDSNTTIADAKKISAEIMMGRANASKLGLTKNDSRAEIIRRKAEFFKEKLKNKYHSIKTIIKNLGDVNFAPDLALNLSDGQTLLITTGEIPKEFVPDDRYVINPIDNHVWFNGEVDMGPANGLSFYKVGVSGYTVVKVNKLTDIEGIVDNNKVLLAQAHYTEGNLLKILDLEHQLNLGVIDDISLNTAENALRDYAFDKFFNEIKKSIANELNELSDKNYDANIHNKAVAKYNACIAQGDYVIARIPTQAMQSFMDVHVVQYVDSESNEIYVPAQLAWLEGSDYDIDKDYGMTYESDDEGFLATFTNIDRYYDAKETLRLPKPDNSVTWESSDGLTMPITAEDLGEDGQVSLDWVEKALKFQKTNPENKVFTPVIAIPGYVLGSDEANNLIDEAVKRLNVHNRTKLNNKRRTAALKNSVVYHIEQVCKDPATQVDAQLPINMDEAKAAASGNNTTTQSWEYDPDRQMIIFESQYDNSVGKTVIGKVAVSLKGYFATLSSFSNTIQEITNVVKEKAPDWEAEVIKLLKQITFNTSGDAFAISTLANLNFSKLLKEVPDTIAIDINKLTANSSTTGSYVDGYYDGQNFQLKRFIEDLNKQSNGGYWNGDTWVEVDAAMGLSGLLSAATDNAKELLLSKLNATSEFVDFYTGQIAVGKSLLGISKSLVSDVFGLIQKFTTPTMFFDAGSFPNVSQAISFMRCEGDLSFAPKGIMQAIIKDKEFRAKVKQIYVDQKNDKKIKDILTRLNNGDDAGVNKMLELFMLDEYRKVLNEIALNVLSSYAPTAKTKSKKQQGVQLNQEQTDLKNEDEAQNENNSENEEESEDEEDSYGIDYDVEEEENVRKKRKTNWIDNLEGLDLETILDSWIYLKDYVFVRNEFLSTHRDDANKITITLKAMLAASEEQNMLGKMCSINQGLKTDDYDEYKWIADIESFVNKRYYEVNSGLKFKPFDFIKFLTDDAYREEQINQYDNVKSTRNILRIFKTTKHFAQMAKFAAMNRAILNNSSVFAIERIIVKDLLQKGSKDAQGNQKISTSGIPEWMTKKLSEKAFAVIKQQAASILVKSFLGTYTGKNTDPKHANRCFEFKIPSSQTKVGGKYLLFNGNANMSDNGTIYSEIYGTNIACKAAAFKTLVEQYVVPMLKANISSDKDGYEFLHKLKIKFSRKADSKQLKSVLQLDISTTKIDGNSDKTAEYKSVLNSFKKIMDMPLSAIGVDIDTDSKVWTVGEALYAYNLIATRDGFGENGLTRLFEDSVLTDSIPMMQDYYQYVHLVDSKEIPWEKDGEIDKSVLSYSPLDIAIAIARNSPSDSAKIGTWVKFDYPPIDYNSYAKPGIMRYTETKPNKNTNWRAVGNLIETMTLGYASKKSEISTEGTPLWKHQHNNISTINEVDRPVKLSDVAITVIDSLSEKLGRKVPVRFYTEDNLSNWPEREREAAKGSNGFVTNGEIWVNVSAAQPKEVQATVIHEFMHLLAAGMKFGSAKNGQISDWYYKMVSIIMESDEPAIKEVRDTVMRGSLVGTRSDIAEEVFIRLLEKAIKDNPEKAGLDGIGLNTDMLKDYLIETLTETLHLNDTEVLEKAKLEDIAITSVVDLVRNCDAEFLHDEVDSLFTIHFPMNQELVTLKRALMNAKGANGEQLVKFEGC